MGFITSLLGIDSASNNAEASYQRSLQQYEIDKGYYTQLTQYQQEMENFALQQQQFAYSQQAYGAAEYSKALADRAAEIQYRNESVYNQQFAAKADYLAQEHVRDILQLGANEQAKQVIADTLRSVNADKRLINLKSETMMGTVIANTMSGIAQGRSKDRLIANEFMERNRQMAQVKSKAKTSMIQTLNQRDKVINDTNLKTAEAYRGLEAIMKLKPAPVPHVPAPQPVFTALSPVAPLQPLGAPPAQYESPGVGETLINAGESILFGWLGNL